MMEERYTSWFRNSSETYTPQYDNEFERKPTDDIMRLNSPWKDNANVPAIVVGAFKDMVSGTTTVTAVAAATSTASASSSVVVPPKTKAGGEEPKTKPPPPGVPTQGVKPPPPLRGGAERRPHQ